MNVGDQVWVAGTLRTTSGWLVAKGGKYVWLATNPVDGKLTRCWTWLVYKSADDAARATGLLRRLVACVDQEGFEAWFFRPNPALNGHTPGYFFARQQWESLESMLFYLESGVAS